MQIINRNVNEIEFWSTVLRLLNVRNSMNVLKDKDIYVTSFILSLDLEGSYFDREGSKVVSERLKNCSYNEVNRIKVKLLELGIIKEEIIEEDKRKRKYTFDEFFLDLKNSLDSNQDFKFEVLLNVDK